MGMINGVLERLRSLAIATKVFTDVEPDPTLGMVTKVHHA
jgi:alcohol dehydrogenase class IV